jgi:hypothetical protein
MRNRNKTPFNEQGIRHGYWEQYHRNNKLYLRCHYINGEEFGYHQKISYNKKFKINEYYVR